ncbi:MAG: hypothetical protein ACOC7K_01570 [bacterium]
MGRNPKPTQNDLAVAIEFPLPLNIEIQAMAKRGGRLVEYVLDPVDQTTGKRVATRNESEILHSMAGYEPIHHCSFTGFPPIKTGGIVDRSSCREET